MRFLIKIVFILKAINPILKGYITFVVISYVIDEIRRRLVPKILYEMTTRAKSSISKKQVL